MKMPEKDAVIEGLKHMLDDIAVHKSACDTCPYNPAAGHKWPYGCIAGQANIIQDAIILLERGRAE